MGLSARLWQQLSKPRFTAFVQSIKDLASFRAARGGFVADAPKKAKLRRTWSMAGVKASDASLLQELGSSGRRLDELTNHPGFKDLLEAKSYYQALSDWKTKTPSLSEHDRFQAAVEWATIEGFFKEVYGRIRRGREADAKLSKVVTRH